MQEKQLTHLNEKGRARMVDVSEKAITERFAKAKAIVRLNEDTFNLLLENGIKKGDVLAVSQVASIMAAKNTSNIIPMCHPIIITGADVDFILDKEKFEIKIISKIKCKGETGVEMEALTAVTVAALTIYDMCKAYQKDIEIVEIKLLEKSGGKSGHFKRED